MSQPSNGHGNHSERDCSAGANARPAPDLPGHRILEGPKTVTDASPPAPAVTQRDATCPTAAIAAQLAAQSDTYNPLDAALLLDFRSGSRSQRSAVDRTNTTLYCAHAPGNPSGNTALFYRQASGIRAEIEAAASGAVHAWNAGLAWQVVPFPTVRSTLAARDQQVAVENAVRKALREAGARDRAGRVYRSEDGGVAAPLVELNYREWLDGTDAPDERSHETPARSAATSARSRADPADGQRTAPQVHPPPERRTYRDSEGNFTRVDPYPEAEERAHTRAARDHSMPGWIDLAFESEARRPDAWARFGEEASGMPSPPWFTMDDGR